MLADSPLNPVLPAQDGDRARAFYTEVLGLRLLSGPQDDPMMFAAGGDTTIVVTEIPDRVPPDYPVVAFLVSGIEELTAGLHERGVDFQPIGAASFQGVQAEESRVITDFGPVKSAWLRDSEGNLLALNEIAGGAA